MKTSLPCKFCTKAKWTRQEVLWSCTDHCVQHKHASTHMQRKRTKKPDIHICSLKPWLDWLQQKHIFLKVWHNSPWTFGCLNCAVSSASSIWSSTKEPAAHNRRCSCCHPAVSPSTPAEDDSVRIITFHLTLTRGMKTVWVLITLLSLFSQRHFSSSKAMVGQCSFTSVWGGSLCHYHSQTHLTPPTSAKAWDISGNLW